MGTELLDMLDEVAERVDAPDSTHATILKMKRQIQACKVSMTVGFLL